MFQQNILIHTSRILSKEQENLKLLYEWEESGMKLKHRAARKRFYDTLHIKQNNNYVVCAAILMGIAAFFYSTKIFTFAHIMAYLAEIFNLHLSVFVRLSVFLSKKIWDKPCCDRPRCRSPPFPIWFAIQKTKSEERQ